MLIASGRWEEINDDFIFNKIPTTYGQTGSPIYKILNGNIYIIGIHVTGDQMSKMNVGIRLNYRNMQEIKKWAGLKT